MRWRENEGGCKAEVARRISRLRKSELSEWISPRRPYDTAALTGITIVKLELAGLLLEGRPSTQGKLTHKEASLDRAVIKRRQEQASQTSQVPTQSISCLFST